MTKLRYVPKWVFVELNPLLRDEGEEPLTLEEWNLLCEDALQASSVEKVFEMVIAERRLSTSA